MAEKQSSALAVLFPAQQWGAGLSAAWAAVADLSAALVWRELEKDPVRRLLHQACPPKWRDDWLNQSIPVVVNLLAGELVRPYSNDIKYNITFRIAAPGEHPVFGVL